MTKTLMFEADVISGMDDLRGQFPPTVPTLPMDDPLFGFDKKARDRNRLPARIMEDSWIRKVSTGNVEITDELTGLPAKLEKHTPVIDPEDVGEIEISPELHARIRKISEGVAAGVTRSFSRSLGKALPPSQPLAKRASVFCGSSELRDLDEHFDDGRKILSVERRGKAKITKFEGGERWEIVES